MMGRATRHSKFRRRSGTGGGQGRYHHGNLRRALLDAALELVETGGTRALTLRATARLAGVSQAAPYRHFADKEALLAAVAEEGFRTMAEAMRRAAATCGDNPLERFRALGLSYVGFATNHPSYFRVMFGREMADRSAYPSLREAALETFRMLISAIADCQGAGLVRPGDPQELALSAWSGVHGVSALLVDGQFVGLQDKPAGELAEDVTRDLFLGLGPPHT